jgi:hypothetical protein
LAIKNPYCLKKITGEIVGRMQVVQWLNENHPGLLPFLKLRFSA